MNWRLKALCVLLTSGGIALMVAACQKEEVRARTVAPDPLQHGKYIVESVGQCLDCHTPMTPQGPDMANHLKGAKLAFAPSVPVPGWVDYAPNIAGLPNGWSKEHMATFLQTGVRPSGTEPGPPMPRYRLNETDAKAAAEYLASLKEAAK